MTKVYCWAPIIDPQQEAADYGMKKLMTNIDGLGGLWKNDAKIEFVKPSLGIMSGSYDITGAAANDIIIIYGHGSEVGNTLYNYEDLGLTKCNKMRARDLPERLVEQDWLKPNNSYYFLFCVCYSGKYKELDLLTGPSTGSFIEEFRDAAREKTYFRNSVLWGPKGVAYREISPFGWIEYEDAKKAKHTYAIKKLMTDGEVHINNDIGYQRIKI